ncbi:hypothetical protein G6F56_009270 [Rhizopus delemar]|nr:hypothetical protein G6F56_009270 [Rhizopus delemar]
MFSKEYYIKLGNKNTEVVSTPIKSRVPKIHFEILIHPQYQNDHGQATCSPGSVVEGLVKAYVTMPTIIKHIKLIFEATEKLNYAAMGWEKARARDGRLFSASKVLWGSSEWSIIDVGEYIFPFICQMPVVNFPPTFHNHSIDIEFVMFVSAQRPKQTPIISKPIELQFQPIIETITTKNLHVSVQKTQLTRHITAQVSVPRLAYNIHEDLLSIPVTVKFLSEDEYHLGVSQLQIYITRCYQVFYKNYSRSETTTITSCEIKKLHTHSTTHSFQLKLDDQKKNIQPTLNYSSCLKVEYRMVVAVKVRHGLINIKNKLFDEPLTFGTLSPGVSTPRLLEPYTRTVDNRSGVIVYAMCGFGFA